MARPPSRQKTLLSKNVIELRKRLGLTQQAFSQEVGVTLATVARWESAVPPRGPSLRTLRDFAKKKGYLDLAEEFNNSLEQLPEEAVATLDAYFVDADDWDGVKASWQRLHEIISAAGLPKKTVDECEVLIKTLSKRYRRIIARRERQIYQGGM